MSQTKIAEEDPRSKILRVATRLFSERGLDATSVRDITSEARVNLGAINYYFGSKEHLIREIFQSMLDPVNSRRLALLDQVEAQAGDGPLDMELVLRALIEPSVREVVGQKGPSTALPRLMFQAYSVSRPFLDDELAEKNDHAARRFIAALSRAAPHVSYEDICWRYYTVIGGFLQVISDSERPQRLRRLSDGRCDTGNADQMIEELITFFVAGMTAPAPGSRRREERQPATEPEREPPNSSKTRVS